MNLRDTLKSAVSFFAPGTSANQGRSLSAQRAQDRWQFRFLGVMGQRVANDDPILNVHGGGNLDLWRDILDDERCYSCFQQRRLAVVSRSWEVEPGAQDRKSKKAAEFLRAQLERIGWDRICDRMLHGVWYGYGVGEAVWEVLPAGDEFAGLIGLARIDVPDRAWFGFTASGELRILDPMGVRDEPVPDRKFWSYSSGGDHDFVHYGIGLAHWLFWPVFFKRQGFPFWLKFLERFGSPTTVGKVKGGHLDTEPGKQKVIDILKAITGNSSVAVPDWMEVDLLEAATMGSGGFELLIDRCDRAITQVILSQSMTSDAGPAGLGSNQATVHKDVRDEVVSSDADLLHESFNRSIACWLTEFNFPGAVPPRVYRIMEDPEDLNTLADRDTTLKALGWIRTEGSFREIYGEGYEKAPEPTPQPDSNAPDNDNGDQQFDAQDIDDIDRIVTEMGASGTAAIEAFIAPLRDKLEGLHNPEILRVALLNHLETADTSAFEAALANPMLAVRAATEAGIDTGRLVPPTSSFAAKRRKRNHKSRSSSGKGASYREDDHPRGPGGKWVDKPDTTEDVTLRIQKHVTRALSSGREHSTTSLGKVSASNAESVRQQTGVSIANHERVIESSDIRHVMKSHGDAAVEQARGQLAVVKGDFAKIPALVENAQSVRLIGRPGARKVHRLEYVGRIDGYEYRYVEEIRSATKIVALKAMLKRV